MIPMNAQLEEHMATLTDDELIRQLHSGDLTITAAGVARAELVARGIDPETKIAPHARAENTSAFHQHVSAVASSLGQRVVNFPYRALLGMESLWLVIFVGVAGLFLLFKLISFGLAELMVMRPVPPYALVVGYAALTVYAAAALAFAIALWNTGGSMQISFRKGVARALAILAVIHAIFGTIGAGRVLDAYVGDKPSIME